MEATRSDSYARYLKAERKTAGDSSRYTGWLASDANVLRIPNDGIHISFNPNDRVIPLADRAVVLRNVTLRGKWGTLVVKQGLVRMNDWSAFLAAAPQLTKGNRITGADYTLTLLPGWEVRHTESGWRIVSVNEIENRKT